MEGERPFIVEAELTKPESTKQLVRNEMLADISVFPGKVQPWVVKFLAETPLTPDEQAEVNAARDVWWEDKYGFPYLNKSARGEVLRRKYAPPQELEGVRRLQEKFFDAALGDGAGLAELKKEYVEEFPDQLEGIEALFELPAYFQKCARLKKSKSSASERLQPKERRELLEDVTQDQFLFTHFILNYGKDKQFMSKFWGVAEKLAKENGNLEELNKCRRGWLSQVAVFRILQEVGAEPKLSHPRQDAFDAIDLWSGGENEQPVQVKGGNVAEPVLIPTEDICPVGAEVEVGDEVRHFDSHLERELHDFRIKVGAYGQRIGRKLKGFLIQVPKSKIDHITGEPSADIIEFVRKNLPR